MAQRVQFGVVLSGDHRGAVRSTRVTRRELKNLRGEVDRTGRAARETNQRFQRWGKSMGALRGAIGPLVGIAGAGLLARLSQQAIASTAAIDDQAATAGIGAEQFQELTKAWQDMAGVAESVSSGGLRRFNRRLGLARQGGGAALDTLERLNINLRQDTPDALEESIRKLAQIEDAQDRAAASSQLFGEDAGPQIAAALGQGLEAIEATIERLHEMGRVMDDETTEAASEMNRRFDELSDTLNTRFKSAIVNALDGWRDLLELTEEGQFEGLQDDLDRLANARDRILANIDTSPWPEQLREELQRVNEEMLAIQRRMQEIQGGPGGLPDDGETQTLSSHMRLLQEIDAKREEMLASGAMSSAPVPGAGLVRGGNPLEAGGPGTPQQTSFGGGVVGISTQTPGGGPMLMAEAFRRLAADADDARDSVEDVEDAGRDLDGLGQDLGLTFSSSLEDAIVKGENLRSVFQGLAQDIQRIVVRRAVTEPLADLVSGVVTGALEGKASGGPVRAGQSYIVGERGPELLRMGRSGGNVVPNHQLRAGGSHGPNFEYVDLRGASPAAVAQLERLLVEVNASIEQRSVRAVFEAQARGGL